MRLSLSLILIGIMAWFAPTGAPATTADVLAAATLIIIGLSGKRA